MINVNELRKGNFVFVNNLKSWSELQNIPMQVTGLGYNSTELDGIKDTVTVKKAIESKYDIYYDYSQFAQFIEPIELNETMLLEFGFVKSSSESDVAINYFFETIEYTDLYFTVRFLKRSNVFKVKYNEEFLRTFKYVHELQNLIFAISGIELTIKQAK